MRRICLFSLLYLGLMVPVAKGSSTGKVYLYFDPQYSMLYSEASALPLAENEVFRCALVTPPAGVELTAETPLPFSIDQGGNLLVPEELSSQGYSAEYYRWGGETDYQLIPKDGLAGRLLLTVSFSSPVYVYLVAQDTRDGQGICGGTPDRCVVAFGATLCGKLGGGLIPGPGLPELYAVIGQGWECAESDAEGVTNVPSPFPIIASTSLSKLEMNGQVVTDREQIDAALTPSVSAFAMETEGVYALTLQPPTAPGKVFYTVETAETLQGPWLRVEDVVAEMSETEKKAFAILSDACYTRLRIGEETRLVLPEIPSETGSRFYRVVGE